MRNKYNAIYSNSVNTETSYIQRYLGAELETVLNPQSNSIHGIEFDSIYVNLPAVEPKLEPFRSHMDNDRCLFVTGLTGCGKSSLLNHTFHTEEKGIHIENNSLYIPFSFDHTIPAREKTNVDTYFVNVIKAACALIFETINKKGLTSTNHGLYEYIEKVRKDNLQYDDGIEGSNEIQKLNNLCKKNATEFYALKLKYGLTVLKEINHVVLIVDDIESVGYQMELVPIDVGLTVWSCLKRQPKETQKIWSSCVIISCRHYIYRMIQKHAIESKYTVKSGIDSQTLESYPIDDEINIAEPAKLIDIVEKRVQALKKQGDNKRWNDALAIVEHILIKVDDNFGDFISALCISNIRKSLTVLKKVVFNKRWIQRNWQEEAPGAFSIDSIQQFNLNPPCLLRAIGLGEGNIYDENSIIPNILFNTFDKNSDLITLIVLKAFIIRINERATDWRTSLERDEIIKELKSVLRREELHPFVEASVRFLIENRLLLRSKNQTQDDGLDINEDNIASIKKVYVSRAAFALWNQLGRSSVLLELFTDDIYIDYPSEPQGRQSFSVFDSRTFEKCIDFLYQMVECEKKIRFDAKNDGLSKKMNALVGSEFITKQMLNGLIASRRAYYKTTGDYEEELNKIERKIIQYTNQIEYL